MPLRPLIPRDASGLRWVRQGGQAGAGPRGAARGPWLAVCRLGIRLTAHCSNQEAAIRWKVGGWLSPSGGQGKASTMFLNTEGVFEDTPTHHRSLIAGTWLGTRLLCARCWEGGGRGGPLGPDSCLLSPQLSGLLQVCVRTGTETQAKFTSVELLRAYISVRGQWNELTGRIHGLI